MILFLSLIFWALWLYMFVLFGRVVIDLVSVLSRDWRPQGLMLVIANMVYRLTDPPLRVISRYVPPLRLGPVALDMGFIILFFGVNILQWIIQMVIRGL